MISISPCYKCLGVELGVTSRPDNLLAELADRITYKIKCQRCSCEVTAKSMGLAVSKWNDLFNEHESNEIH